MTLTPLKDLTYNTTNLTEDATPQWSATSSYAIDTQRQLNNKLYKANTDISELCEYVHDNSDLQKPHYTYKTIDNIEVTNTAVRCQLNVTVVYNKDNNKYYLFDNSTGATSDTGNYYFVDFTTEDPTTPANFTEVTGYRHLLYNPEDTPLVWNDSGYTNKYKCLDQSLSSQTINNTNITMSFIVTKIDEIHLLNLYGTDATIIVNTTDATPIELYNENISLYNKNGGTFYNYFFNDFIYINKLSIDIPIAFEVKVDITITALGGIAKVGLVGIGKSNYTGATLYGAGLGMIDFSKKLTNEDTGENYLEVGNYKATNDLTIDIPSGLTDSVYNLLVDYRAVPVIFRSNIYSNLTIFGIYNKFDIAISTPTISRMNIGLESLI